MKQILVAFFAVVLSFGFVADFAEAKRMGGGKSSGMQRSTAPQQAPQRFDQTPAKQNSAAAAPQKKSSWMGPIAGLAAGLGIAALFSSLGLGEELASFMTMLLIGLVAVMVIGFIIRKMKGGQQKPAMAYGHAGAAGQWQPAPAAQPSAPQTASFERVQPLQPVQPVAQPAASDSVWASMNTTAPAASLPAGFDKAGFERQAKVNFIRLQAAYDAANIDDLREFLSPEMFAEIQLDLAERGAAAQTTEVVELNADVLASVEENGRFITSVRYSGLVREEAGAAPVAINEVWHLVKPVAGNGGWVVAGIQQQ
ncbi:Tim44 domain-containing protein [Chitinibacteraceae bacterium HSL-7]